MDQAGLHVVFGTGPVGLAVVDELLARGMPVRAVNRSGRRQLPPGVQVRSGNAADFAFAREAAVGATVVYNCLNPPYSEWPELFPPLQKSLIEAAAEADATLVAMENCYMYGPTEGLPVTEDAPFTATGKKGRVRARMSEELLAVHEAGKVRTSSGRASDFYGPRALVSTMGERVFYPVLAGRRAPVLGNPDVAHTYHYIPDIARGLVTLGVREEAWGEAWHLPVADTLTTREFLDLCYQAAGTTGNVQAMPNWVQSALGWFNTGLREMA